MSALSDAFKLPLTGKVASYTEIKLEQYNTLTGSYQPFFGDTYVRDDIVKKSCTSMESYSHHGLKHSNR